MRYCFSNGKKHGSLDTLGASVLLYSGLMNQSGGGSKIILFNSSNLQLRIERELNAQMGLSSLETRIKRVGGVGDDVKCFPTPDKQAVLCMSNQDNEGQDYSLKSPKRFPSNLL